jgi:hypothetical protein
VSAPAFEAEEDWGLRAMFDGDVESGPAAADDGFTRSSARLSGLADPLPKPEEENLAAPELPLAPARSPRLSAPVLGARGSLSGLIAPPAPAPVANAQPAPAQPAPAQPAPAQPASARQSIVSAAGSQAPVANPQPVKQNLAPTKNWRPDGKGSGGGKLGGLVDALEVGSEAFETVENAAELVNTGATAGIETASLIGNVSEGVVAGGESVGEVAEQVGGYINPLKDLSPVPIETNNIIQTAGELLNIRRFQRNEGKTLAGSTNAREIDQDNDREAIKATKFNLGFRERAQAQQRAAIAVKSAAEQRGLDQVVKDEAEAQVSAANRGRWKAVGKGVIEQKRLQAIAKGAGYRMDNESSMEQSAYTQDKKFQKRAPVGMEFGGPKEPETGMFETDADGRIVLDATGMPTRVKGEAITAGKKGSPERAAVEAKENRVADLAPEDYGSRAGLGANEGVFNDRRLGYRPETEQGRAKQGQVKAARFIQGAGQLLDDTLDTDRMVNDGRYGAAYAAKAADFAVNVGTSAGADAISAVAPAAGPIAAPILGVTGAVKETVGHVKKELGRGLRSAGEGLEGLIDSKGLAKEQDLKDHRNKWLGYEDPAPQAAQPAGGQAAGAPAPAAATGPAQGMTRAERAAVYGVDFKEQRDPSVLGRRKRTWGRATFDNTIGLAGKAVTGSARALWGVGKGLYQGAKWAGGKVGQGASWLWNKMRGERDGDTARRDLELLRQYQDVSDGEMPAEGAFRGKLGMLDAPDAKYLSERNALSTTERDELAKGLERHKRLYGIGADGKREDAQGNRIVGDRERLLQDVAAKAPSQEQAVAAAKEKERLQELYKQAGSGAGRDREDAITELLQKLEDEARLKQQAKASAGTGSSNPVP